MSSVNAVILVLDRWGAAFTGPYGNTWVRTPALNRLASQSLLIEHALTDSPELGLLYRSYWQGTHALSRAATGGGTSLAEWLRNSGIATGLVTDAAAVAQHPSAAGFEESVAVPPSTTLRPAGEVSQTGLAKLLDRALEWVGHRATPFFLWIHARAMEGPWDAPYQLRLQFADEEDPTPPDFVQKPHKHLAPDHDPDELLGIVHAYAGQVAAMDFCLDAFLESLDSTQQIAKTLLIVTSSRGFPLGEHLVVGGEHDLYNELCHVPCLIRFPDRGWATVRSQTLWQPRHLYWTLVDWFGLTREAHRASLLRLGEDEFAHLTQRACMIAGDQRAIRTPAWFLRLPLDAPVMDASSSPSWNRPGAAELYAKPDDRWEVNNVAARCPDIVQQLTEQLALFEQAADNGTLDQLPDLPEDLARRVA